MEFTLQHIIIVLITILIGLMIYKVSTKSEFFKEQAEDKIMVNVPLLCEDTELTDKVDEECVIKLFQTFCTKAEPKPDYMKWALTQNYETVYNWMRTLPTRKPDQCLRDFVEANVDKCAIFSSPTDIVDKPCFDQMWKQNCTKDMSPDVPLVKQARFMRKRELDRAFRRMKAKQDPVCYLTKK